MKEAFVVPHMEGGRLFVGEGGQPPPVVPRPLFELNAAPNQMAKRNPRTDIIQEGLRELGH